MADPDHMNMLRQSVGKWNAWREREPSITPDLTEADLSGANLTEADLSGATLYRADLSGATLYRADLSGADLTGANLTRASLDDADLSGANLHRADLSGATLSGAVLCETNLHTADLSAASLIVANLNGAVLCEANLHAADLFAAKLNGADLSGATLYRADLIAADLTGANLTGASLDGASLVEANITNANLTGCRMYGVSAWGLTGSDESRQQNLIISRGGGEPEITVDNIEVAQFVYLLLHNAKIRDVIDTVGKKGVLLLGRFTEGRMAVLERLRTELRERGYLPIVFNFDKPETKDFTETVRLLAGLSHFVIADVTNPKSTPLELQATVPEIMVPFLPIIEEGEKPFAMLEDLWIKHRDWVFQPLYYSSLDALVGAVDTKIIRRAEARFDELIVRKAEKMKGEHV